MTFKDIVLLAVLILVSTQNNAPNLQGGRFNNKCCDYHTINVFGSASIKANPDQAILQASISQNGDTVAQAIANLSQAVSSIIAILRNNSLTQDDYFSTGFNVYPNTSYVNGTSTVLGQIASQSFQITIPSIDSNGSNVGQLIDSLATVNGIVISGLSFDIKNKTEIYQVARQEAFAKALDKASDYTEALNRVLGDLITLVDSFSSAPAVTPQPNRFMEKSTPTQVNVGAITINYDVNAIFRYK